MIFTNLLDKLRIWKGQSQFKGPEDIKIVLHAPDFSRYLEVKSAVLIDEFVDGEPTGKKLLVLAPFDY